MFSTIASAYGMIRDECEAQAFRQNVIWMHEHNSSIQKRLSLLAQMLERSQTLPPGVDTRTLLDVHIPLHSDTAEEYTLEMRKMIWEDRCKLIEMSLGRYMPQEVDVETFLMQSKPSWSDTAGTVAGIISAVTGVIAAGTGVMMVMEGRRNSDVNHDSRSQVVVSPSHHSGGDNGSLHNIAVSPPVNHRSGTASYGDYSGHRTVPSSPSTSYARTASHASVQNHRDRYRTDCNNANTSRVIVKHEQPSSVRTAISRSSGRSPSIPTNTAIAATNDNGSGQPSSDGRTSINRIQLPGGGGVAGHRDSETGSGSSPPPSSSETPRLVRPRSTGNIPPANMITSDGEGTELDYVIVALPNNPAEVYFPGTRNGSSLSFFTAQTSL